MLGDERVWQAYDRNAAYWIEVIRNRRDPYQTKLTDPALLQAVGSCRGLEILDAGCGEGYLTRELLRRGAKQVTGIDTCQALITAATSHPERDPQQSVFHHADVAHLPLPDNSIDLVVANRLPNGIREPARRFSEFARVLRPEGRFIALGMHPCFYTDRNTRNDGGFVLDEYFGVRTVEQHFTVEGDVSPAASVQTFYSLEQYLGMITDAGFAITRVREPHPTTTQRRENPWWDANFTRPLFLLIEGTINPRSRPD